MCTTCTLNDTDDRVEYIVSFQAYKSLVGGLIVMHYWLGLLEDHRIVWMGSTTILMMLRVSQANIHNRIHIAQTWTLSHRYFCSSMYVYWLLFFLWRGVELNFAANVTLLDDDLHAVSLSRLHSRFIDLIEGEMIMIKQLCHPIISHCVSSFASRSRICSAHAEYVCHSTLLIHTQTHTSFGFRIFCVCMFVSLAHVISCSCVLIVSWVRPKRLNRLYSNPKVSITAFLRKKPPPLSIFRTRICSRNIVASCGSIVLLWLLLMSLLVLSLFHFVSSFLRLDFCSRWFSLF